MLARAEGYARAEEAFKAKDSEAFDERRIDEPGRLAKEEKSIKAQPHSRTPSERKRARTPSPDRTIQRSIF